MVSQKLSMHGKWDAAWYNKTNCEKENAFRNDDWRSLEKITLYKFRKININLLSNEIERTKYCISGNIQKKCILFLEWVHYSCDILETFRSRRYDSCLNVKIFVWNIFSLMVPKLPWTISNNLTKVRFSWPSLFLPTERWIPTRGQTLPKQQHFVLQ